MCVCAWSPLTSTLLAKIQVLSLGSLFHTLGEETLAAWLLRHAIKFNIIFSGNSTLTTYNRCRCWFATIAAIVCTRASRKMRKRAHMHSQRQL